MTLKESVLFCMFHCVSVCWVEGKVISGSVTLPSVIPFTEAVAVDCCHRNGQPITRSEQQGVGSGHLVPQEEQYL